MPSPTLPSPLPAMRRTDAADAPDQALGDRVPAHSARTLMQGGTTARVVLDDQAYVLRITRAGKLILTK